ncbi:hypothetical protein EYF80_003499 [Liparis tanakae]|uniref:Uncharacterized protein n=1 Tax=Liparis tanakae TaxID=230148 RepID=A0A4Z2J9I0_9TELE|nr:hypothetical protein EYF80_003499 [Liparis tanakae]
MLRSAVQERERPPRVAGCRPVRPNLYFQATAADSRERGEAKARLDRELRDGPVATGTRRVGEQEMTNQMFPVKR